MNTSLILNSNGVHFSARPRTEIHSANFTVLRKTPKCSPFKEPKKSCEHAVAQSKLQGVTRRRFSRSNASFLPSFPLPLVPLPLKLRISGTSVLVNNVTPTQHSSCPALTANSQPLHSALPNDSSCHMCTVHLQPIVPAATFKVCVSILIALVANLVLPPAQSAIALPFPSPIESRMSGHDRPGSLTPFPTAVDSPFQPVAAPALLAFADTTSEHHVHTDKYSGIDFAQLSDDSLISLDYGPELAPTDPSIVQSPNCPQPIDSIGAMGPDSQEDESEAVTNESLVLEVWQVVKDSFLDARHKGWTDAAWEAKKEEVTRRPIRSRMAAYSTISQMLNSLQDPYSKFLSPDQFGQLGKYDVSGVGLNIGEVAADQDATSPPRLQVLGIVRGSPAQLAGMRQGDEIVAVNETSVAGFSAYDASSLIQSSTKGQDVTIQYRHSLCSPLASVTLSRESDVKTPVGYRLERGGSMGSMGYIRLYEFNSLAKKDLVTAVQRLESAGATAYTLDLRNNPGGLVQAGVEIARLFLPSGSTVSHPVPHSLTATRQHLTGDRPLLPQVVYTEGRDPTVVKSVVATRDAITNAPLTVLVNDRTASASEIVAGALHDNCRATLVGDRTFGKGLIQSVYELSDRSGMVLTVGKYVTPAHVDIDTNGIEPDFRRRPDPDVASKALARCTIPV